MENFRYLFTLTIIKLGLTISLFANTPETLLLNHNQSTHFLMHFSAEDQKGVELLMSCLEQNYQRISDDFDYQASKKWEVFVFPSIEAFHTSLDKPNGPMWAIAQTNTQPLGFSIVTPFNHGPEHSVESILTSSLVNMAKLIINEKYSAHQPYWLLIGTAYHEANAMTHEKLKARICELLAEGKPFPAISQLNLFDREIFGAKGGFVYAYGLVEFIVAKCGWKAIIDLLENAQSIEERIGLPEDKLSQAWIDYWTQSLH